MTPDSTPPTGPSSSGAPTLSRDPANGPLGEDLRMRRLRALAKVMDSSIRVPGTNFRFGLDAVVGLVPGLGDVFGALVSGYIVFESARFGASGPTLIRMLGNIGVEALLGAVPALGDLFDAAFRANNRNVRLLEDHVVEPTHVSRRSALTLTAVGAGIFVVVGGLAVLSIWILVTLLRLVTG